MVWTGRGGSSCRRVEQQVPGGPSFSWNCHSLRSGGWVAGEGLGLRGVHARYRMCPDTQAQGMLTREEPGAWEDP